MKSRGCRLIALALLSLAGLGACVAGGYGGVDVGYDGGYYEPGGYGYCCWGPGYFVGPGRGGGFRGPGRPGAAYRGAPAGHATPSIPSGARGGGARGGGGHR
jgi:translation initiation factor IF-2